MKKFAALFVVAFAIQAALVSLLCQPAPVAEVVAQPSMLARAAIGTPQQLTLAQMAVGQVAQRTDFVPRSDVVLYRAGGFVRPFNATANTAVARGTALLAAKAAATSGDLIWVGPGSFTITSGQLLKDDVDWHFHRSIVTLSKDGYGGLFDDSATWGANAAITCTISGDGEFVRTSTDQNFANEANCCVLLDNSSSNVTIHCKSISETGVGESNNGAVRHAGGTLTITCDAIASTNGNGVWWSDGDMYVNADTIVTGASCFYSSATDVAGTGTGHVSDLWASGHAWINARKMQVSGGSRLYAYPIYTVSDITTPRVWIDCYEIDNTKDGAAVAIGGNFVYLRAMKIFNSNTGTILLGTPAIKMFNDGVLWCNVQKIIGGKGGVSGQVHGQCVYFVSGTAWINAENMEDNGSSTEPLVYSSNNDNGNASELHIAFQLAKKTASGTAIKNDESLNTVNVLAGKIITQSGQLDIHRTAGTVTVASSVSFDPAKTTGVFTIFGNVRAPNMTSTQRDAMDNPQPGTVIYNTTTGKLNVRCASTWEAITSS